MKSPGRLKEAVTVWLFFYLFFLVFLVNNFSAAHDSINYLNNITKGEHLFHQHHLLYHFLARQWLLLTGKFLPHVAEHYRIESFTALWGAAILAACYLFFRNRFGFGKATSLSGVLVIGFSFGVWFYSVNIEVYTPPAFFILTCLYVMSSPTSSKNIGWTLGVLNSIAILFHQFNVLFAVVVVVDLYYRRDTIPSVKNFFQYALTGLIISGGAYFLIGWFVVGYDSVPRWIAWMEGYTVGHDYWQPLSFETPLNAATGFGHALIGGHFIFKLPAVENYLLQSFQSHGLSDEVFLASAITHGVAWALTILTIAFALIFLALLWKFIRSYKLLMRKLPGTFVPLVACVVVYSLFFLFWMPEILEFWIIQMIVVWLILLGCLSRILSPFHIKPRRIFLTLAVLLFTINYFGSIRWFQSLNHDLYYNRVKVVKNVATPNDLVVVQNGWILKDFVIRFVQAPVISAEDPNYNPAALELKADDVLSRKGKIYFYPGEAKEGVSSLKEVMEKYRSRERQLSQNDSTVHVIE